MGPPEVRGRRIVGGGGFVFWVWGLRGGGGGGGEFWGGRSVVREGVRRVAFLAKIVGLAAADVVAFFARCADL